MYIMNTVFEDKFGSHIGRVKWFKPKLGYGFITVKFDGSEIDVFVHQSNIRMKYSTFRTLRGGEYVSLDVKKKDDTQDGQAINVTGVSGGPLYCDFIPTDTHDHQNSSEHVSDRNEGSVSAGEGYGYT